MTAGTASAMAEPGATETIKAAVAPTAAAR